MKDFRNDVLFHYYATNHALIAIISKSLRYCIPRLKFFFLRIPASVVFRIVHFDLPHLSERNDVGVGVLVLHKLKNFTLLFLLHRIQANRVCNVFCLF